MESVLIVCGAGASSTFLASRMRSIAKSRGLDLEVSAASDSDLRALLHTSSVLLVGPHLAATFAGIQAEAALFGIPAALLPSTAFGPSGAEEAIELVGRLVSLGPAPATQPDRSKESHG
jgi:PTS system cellobiose-specific IIB component